MREGLYDDQPRRVLRATSHRVGQKKRRTESLTETEGGEREEKRRIVSEGERERERERERN